MTIVAGNARSETAPPFATVQALFGTIADYDFALMERLVTDDFVILEVGELWDLAKTIEVIAPLEGQVTRRNFFHLLRTEIRGNMAWVSYWNKATYRTLEGDRERAWLESAVLVRVNDEWKVEMLHSTRLSEGQLSEDVELVEYVARDG